MAVAEALGRAVADVRARTTAGEVAPVTAEIHCPKCEGDDVKTFNEFFGGKEPAMTRHMVNGARWLSGPSMRKAWKRIAVPEEAVL